MYRGITLTTCLALTLSLSLATPCLAGGSLWVGVRLANQDLAVEFSDVGVTDEIEDYMRINRVYNSISTFSNIFGYGWGSELDTNLVTRPDGQLWYTGFGNGFVRVFSPMYTAAATDKMMNSLENAAIQAGLIGSSDEQKSFVELPDHPWDIMQVYKDMRYAGYLPPSETAIGDMFSDKSNGSARVIAVPEGYQILILEDSRQLPFEALFDKTGRLIRAWVHNEPQKFVSYQWGIVNHTQALGERVVAMSDYRRNFFQLGYDGRGRVVRINAGRFGVATYGYDRANNLVWERDASGGLYRYRYDAYHDLIGIEYPQGNPITFKYEGDGGNLVSLQCSDGTIYEFERLSGELGSATSMRVVTKKGASTTAETMNSSPQMGTHTYCS